METTNHHRKLEKHGMIARLWVAKSRLALLWVHGHLERVSNNAFYQPQSCSGKYIAVEFYSFSNHKFRWHCSEFELVNMYVERNIKYYSCCEQPYPDITYYIHLRRRPMFYVFNMLLPCFLITLVALLGKFMIWNWRRCVVLYSMVPNSKDIYLVKI